MTTTTVSRRAFLKTSGALVVTFGIGHPLSQAAPLPGPGKSLSTAEVDGFIAIDGEGNVTIYSGKVDLGTGVHTALTQIAAEELCVPMKRVEMVTGDTALTPDQGTTWGSLTIQAGGMQIRRACATAREMLILRASEYLGVPADGLYAKDGEVMRRNGGPGVPYAQLIGGRAFEMKVNDKVALKAPSTYTIVGQPVRRLDIPAKVTGRFTYMQDMKIPGMVHARVVRPAAMKADLQSYDEAAAKKIPGYLTAIRKGNFLAAVARDEWAAIRCAHALRPTWSQWEGLPDSATLWDHVRSTTVVKDEVFQNVGNVEGVEGAKTLSATYDFAIHTHGSIGPSCAIADYKDGRLTVWTASQATHLLRKQLANMLSMKPDKVRCLYVEGSGCYGRNGHEDAAADAALLATQVGRPVRVQWSRQDEHGWDPKGPPTLLEHRATLDADGAVVAWESAVYIPDRPKGFEVTLVAAEHAGMPKDTAFPGNIHQSLAIPYAFPNVKATAKWLAETPFKPSWIRTPGRMQNTYANESFIDEVAAASGFDPVEFRVQNLKDARGIECIERCAKLAKWTPRTGARDGGEIVKGRGFSYIKYELVRTYVAVVADVEVNRRTGHVRVTDFYCAHDCGQIINPDGLKNQIEGNIVQTVSRTLIEELKFDRSRVTSVDWKSYPILAFPDVPNIAIDLISRPTEVPWGAGEPAAAVVPSAIANALYDATGVRLRSVPFTPPKVLAALKSAQGGLSAA
jgi:CO/xanthine dehydrogenase Mo-binding subunit